MTLNQGIFLRSLTSIDTHSYFSLLLDTFFWLAYCLSFSIPPTVCPFCSAFIVVCITITMTRSLRPVPFHVLNLGLKFLLKFLTVVLSYFLSIQFVTITLTCISWSTYHNHHKVQALIDSINRSSTVSKASLDNTVIHIRS